MLKSAQRLPRQAIRTRLPDAFEVVVGDGPVMAAAIHHGHFVRPEVEEMLALDEAVRLREEDPFTGLWTTIVPTRVVGMRSRFEFDLNRPREKAVYLMPEDAWGLNVWRLPPGVDILRTALNEYDHFYQTMELVLDHLLAMYGRVVILDLHTYNHRREGIECAPGDPCENPDINVGTGTMDRARWAPLVTRFISDAHHYDFLGRRLDVRENIRFRGGQLSRWAHTTYPDSVCSLSIEVKKFFMNEWTAEADAVQLRAIRELLRSTLPGIRESLEGLG
jgi:N-formylglutamate amidohydrolase